MALKTSNRDLSTQAMVVIHTQEPQTTANLTSRRFQTANHIPALTPIIADHDFRHHCEEATNLPPATLTLKRGTA